MKIALSGYYGFDNAGDEALLSAITTSIKKIAPEAKFVVFSGAPQKTAALHDIPAVHYMKPLQILRELVSSDLLISGGGSIFQDVTSARSLPYYISVVALAKLLRKPVIFYAQGVGPINRPLSKFLMRLIANRVNLITLRDEASRQYLLDLGVTRPPLKVTADPVFSLESGPEEDEQMKALLNLDNPERKPLIGISVRQWKPLEGYQEELALLLDDLADRGYDIVFIPMAYPEDIEESRRVMHYMKRDARLIDQNLTSREHLALISHLDLMIAMRLHALIFAAARGIPFAGISYDPKIDAFLDLFACKPLPGLFAEMKQEIDELLSNEQMQKDIAARALDMHQKSEQNARLALSLVHRKMC
ncbi:MAG: polysaccharide pyruvyl transferase CsaB [Bacillota bacterium]|nr:polysaccharide pyruvyl transferase CsaB [Bacillota bacterium]